jgi:hypothetical protein
MIIARPYPRMQNEIHDFLRSVGAAAALIRHDKHPEAPPYPRGGFLVGEALLDETISFFFELGRIVAIYEPANPLLNGHNLNLLFESTRQITVEVCGPGFDASDLQRGDLTPHEILSVLLSASGEVQEIKRIRLVDQDAYVESVRLREDKIKEKLETLPTTCLAQRIREDMKIPGDLDTYLQIIGSQLYNSQSYQPVAEDFLRGTISTIVNSGVIGSYVNLTNAKFPLVFSTSLVNKGEKQVFWDIVSPTLKFEGLNRVRSTK